MSERGGFALHFYCRMAIDADVAVDRGCSPFIKLRVNGNVCDAIAVVFIFSLFHKLPRAYIIHVSRSILTASCQIPVTVTYPEADLSVSVLMVPCKSPYCCPHS